jgi:hypothetical protein
MSPSPAASSITVGPLLSMSSQPTEFVLFQSPVMSVIGSSVSNWSIRPTKSLAVWIFSSTMPACRRCTRRSKTSVSRYLIRQAVNLKGPFRLAVLVGSRMAADSGGSIINVGSVEAIRPHARALPYAAAKAGLSVISEGLARALAPKVRVNTVQPGPFLTDIAAHWADGVREEAEAAVALQRCAEPDEIVGAVLFLATSASSYVTGAVLRVDGGMR